MTAAAARCERLAFFGTPEFSVATLDALERAGRRPVLVVSQPDRPVGRGRRLQPPPVAAWARARGLPVVQPRRVRDRAFLDQLDGLALDVAIVVAFGQIFPARLLAIPRFGCINLHASLLPRHRGASPIAAAILAGDHTTGVATMQMGEGLDDGPVLLERAIPLGPADTTASLSQRLAALGGELVVETLAALEAGTLVPRPQDQALATLAPKIEKDAAIIDWRLPAELLDRRRRAFFPWPGFTTSFRGQPLQVAAGHPCSGEHTGVPGELTAVKRDGIDVACGEGVFRVTAVQRPGRRVLPVADFINSERPRLGERFGDVERAERSSVEPGA